MLEWIGTVAAVLALTALAASFGWFWRIDETLYDAALSVRQRPAPADIVIVAIDQQSLDQIGRWPWRRAIHATLIEHLTAAGAKAVGMDILLTEPDRADPRGDEVLAESLRRNGRVVLPVIMEAMPGGQLREVRPTPGLAAAAGALGHVHIELDADGIARSLYLREGLAGGTQYPHFSVAVATLAAGGTEPPLGGRRSSTGSVTGPAGAVWSRDHWVHLAYLGPPGQFSRVSYVDVLRGAVPNEAFAGKLVLVGATAAGMMDSYPTPVSGFGRSMPGVEVSANALAGLRGEGFITIAPLAAQALLSTLLVLMLLGAYLRLSPKRALLFTALAIPGVLAAAIAIVYLFAWWFAPSAAIFGLLLCYPVWSWRRLEAAQRYMDEELAQAAREPDLLPLESVERRPRGSVLTDKLENRIEAVRRASARVRDMRRFVADTLDGLPSAALVVDTDMRLILCNAQAAKLIGRPQAMLGGRRLADVLAPVLAQGAPQWSALLAGAPLAFESRHTDGRDLFVGVVPFAGSGGERRGLLLNLVDVSSLKSAERKRDEYMRFLSHDLRSPLVSISALLDLRELAPQSVKADFFDQIRRSVERSLSLAEDFVQLGRAEAIDESRFAAVNLVDLLRSAVREAESIAQAKEIEISLLFTPGTALTRGIQDVLFRVLINLLSNAIKYSPPKTHIRCSIESEGERWRCTVADEGFGISAAELPRLFDRYERLAAAQRRGEAGTGLGLAFVKTAVEKHGGRMEVQSEEGKGSRFSVLLPALR